MFDQECEQECKGQDQDLAFSPRPRLSKN